MLSLTIAVPEIRTASHGIVQPSGGTTTTSPGTSSLLSTVTSSVRQSSTGVSQAGPCRGGRYRAHSRRAERCASITRKYITSISGGMSMSSS
ncbi:hypothetical protein E2C01_016054 [Portunus trituberculatus]|uniref:Uncharacterized protein n=1 Tax=Portunus trituberculatus TaxID=210409 RepID=A0A5B7DNI9_PORTR|nr:hypothetical protein [Portunus trituberculatus]